MTIDTASFKLRFPEFDTILDARIQLFIDDAVIVLNESFWDTKYDLGLSYLTAHYLALSIKSDAGSNAPNAPVANKSVDGVSIGYTNPTFDTSSEAYYGSTGYGQRYLVLRSTLGVVADVI